MGMQPEFFLNVVEFGMDLQAAIHAPLVHTLHFPSSFYPHDAHPLEVVIEARLAGSVRDAFDPRGPRGRGCRGLDEPVMSLLSATPPEAVCSRARPRHAR